MMLPREQRSLRGAVVVVIASAVMAALGACGTKASTEPPDVSVGGSATGGVTASAGRAGSGGTGASSSSGASASAGSSTTGAGGAIGSGGTPGTSGVAGTSTNGGAPSTGGAAGSNSAGRSGSGGAAAAGATGASGAVGSGGGGNVTEVDRVTGWLNNTRAMGALPNYAYTNIRNNFNTPALFNKLVTGVVNACAAFAPTALGVVDCEAIVVSAMVAESSYNPLLVVQDAYGGAADPTVGLLQVRFSSTVHDYNFYGPLAAMSSIGCTWPTNLPTNANDAQWRTLGGMPAGLALMQDPACNVGLATWYYFYNATCNGGGGGANAVFIAGCCSGMGRAGTVVNGLLSHLNGPNGNVTDATNPYVVGIKCCAGGNPTVTPCTGCTGRFAAMLGGLPTPDPFTISLAPQPTKYCR